MKTIPLLCLSELTKPGFCSLSENYFKRTSKQSSKVQCQRRGKDQDMDPCSMLATLYFPFTDWWSDNHITVDVFWHTFQIESFPGCTGKPSLIRFWLWQNTINILSRHIHTSARRKYKIYVWIFFFKFYPSFKELWITFIFPCTILWQIVILSPLSDWNNPLFLVMNPHTMF